MTWKSISLEEELREFFVKYKIPSSERTQSTKELDFRVLLRGDTETEAFEFDAKEKRQPVRNFVSKTMKYNMFILDDLAARKVLLKAPNSGIVIRDSVKRAYFLFTVLDLYLIPKKRVNRTILDNKLKGKWIIDIRNGFRAETLLEIFKEVQNYLENTIKMSVEHSPCFNKYHGEDQEIQGTNRGEEYFRDDFKKTR